MTQKNTAGSYPALWFLPRETSVTPERIAEGIRTLPNLFSWVTNEAEHLPFLSWEILEAIAQRLPERAGYKDGVEYWSTWAPLVRCSVRGGGLASGVTRLEGDAANLTKCRTVSASRAAADDADFGAVLEDWAFHAHGSIGDAATSSSQWRSAATLWLKTTPHAGEGNLAKLLAKAVQRGRYPVAAAQTLAVARDIPTSLLLEIAPFLSIDIGLPFLMCPNATPEVWLAWARSKWGVGHLPQELAYTVACRADLRTVPELRAMALSGAWNLLEPLEPLAHLYAQGEGQAFWVEACARSANKTYLADGSANDASEIEFHLEAQAMLDKAVGRPASEECLLWLSQSDSAEIRKWMQMVYLPQMTPA